MSARLDGKVAIVTETQAGIGRATALRFARESAAVVCPDVERAAAEATARLITDAGGAARAACTVVSSAALFLASDESAGTTGTELVVDGGQTAW